MFTREKVSLQEGGEVTLNFIMRAYMNSLKKQ